eukprot:comp16116_c0_seq1/m.13669 comp16116_c0_seq1/g.13669  ORF comp16116_c0_seq1/g.13669 comp16116_c0_seq1/m.13669 type:complete len:481 (-) comp16116_c0_seq1:383-1825(-)
MGETHPPVSGEQRADETTAENTWASWTAEDLKSHIFSFHSRYVQELMTRLGFRSKSNKARNIEILLLALESSQQCETELFRRMQKEIYDIHTNRQPPRKPATKMPPRSSTTSHGHFAKSGPVKNTKPAISFKQTPYFTFVRELVPPTQVSTTVTGSSQRITLTAAEKQALDQARGQRTPTTGQLRMVLRVGPILTDGNEMVDDQFPDLMKCVVQGREATYTGTPLAPHQQVKRCTVPDTPKDITAMCDPNLPAISLRCHTQSTKATYFLRVELVRYVAPSTLVERLAVLSSQAAYKTWEELMGMNDVDGEVHAGPSRISLLCPVGKVRMGRPCRGRQCRHVQCFDALLFISMNERRPNWACPVCNKKTHYSDLVIDEYFQGVLSGTNADLREVEVGPGVAGWRIPAAAQPASQAPAPKQKTASETSSNAGSNKRVVDLTISSDEEDELPLKKHKPEPQPMSKVGAARTVETVIIIDSDDE